MSKEKHKYIIRWVDKVTYSVEVDAESDVEALKLFHNDHTIFSNRVEEDVEYLETPWVSLP